MKSARFLERIKRLQGSFDAVYVENPIDLYYLTGLKLSAGRLVAHKDACHLFVDGRYLQIAQERAPCPCSLDSSKSLSEYLQQMQIHTIAFDADHTTFARYEQLIKQAPCQWRPNTLPFHHLRLIKDGWEIEKMKKSAQLAWKGYQWILSSLKEGITEKQLSKGFEIFCLQNGADKLSFEPIIAFGANGAMPHYRSQEVPLRSGDVVLIDIGVVLDSYHSDMTRVSFFQSENKEIHRLYEIAKRSFNAALALCRPGQTFGALDLAARAVMKQEGVEELFVHSLGHGIGLETHEFPRIKFNSDSSDLKLEAGMVFTIEPGLYVPGKGGVRYEDTIVITNEGHENFYG